jgi:hypothetical protein
MRESGGPFRRERSIETPIAQETPSIVEDATEGVSRKPGRPKAKHSDKVNYAQMSLYIRREIRNRTKARLFEQGLEFSALVESFLEVWLIEQDKK